MRSRSPLFSAETTCDFGFFGNDEKISRKNN